MEYQLFRAVIIGFLIVLACCSIGAILATLGAAHLRSKAEQAREDRNQLKAMREWREGRR